VKDPLTIVQNMELTLTEEEYQTIVNSDKGDDDLQSKYHSTPLAQIVKQGFELAIFEQKNG
jgi:hypothetical protein